MTEPTAVLDAALLPAGGELEAVLAAWHAATLRLEKTHQALRGEVRRLTDELEAKNRELARKNRLADLGRMASHVAHEVRNSLVPVTLYLSFLKRRIADDAEALEVFERIEAGFTALETTVCDLLQFTSDRDPQREALDPAAFFAKVLDTLAPQLAAQGIRPRIEVPRGMRLRVDGEMLRRAVTNLALNAIDAMPQGGTLSLSAVCEGPAARIEVADTGSGLGEETLARAFEPFFTTKRGGTGLGLAIVCRVAESHGGRCEAVNRPGGGAVFTLRIPEAAVPEEAMP